MKKFFQYFFVLLIVIAIILISGNSMSWANVAGKSTEENPEAIRTHRPRPTPRKHPQGSVPRWPGPSMMQTGWFSISGVCTVYVEYLADGYWIQGDVFEDYYLLGKLSEGAGNYISGFSTLENYYNDELLYRATSDQIKDKVCFALPPTSQGNIYVFDITSETPTWTPLDTTLEGLFVCAPAPLSGVYTLVGH